MYASKHGLCDNADTRTRRQRQRDKQGSAGFSQPQRLAYFST